MLFATIVGFGCICRPSSSPICSPICSRLVTGPISAPAGRGTGPGFRLDVAVETEAPAAPDRPIDRSLGRSKQRSGSAQPSHRRLTMPPSASAWQGSYGSLLGHVHLSRKERIERIDRAQTIERARNTRVFLFFLPHPSRDLYPPRDDRRPLASLGV